MRREEIFIRLYADCADAPMAQGIAASLLARLRDHAPSLVQAPCPYWKMPQLYGFELMLGQSSEVVFQQLIASPALHWAHAGDEHDRSSVWNPAKDGAHFLIPQARWAEVQFTVREA